MWREFAEAGGLASYGTSLTASYSEAGRYVARVLSGIRIADLPVVRTSRFELVVNARTARSIRFDLRAAILAQADEILD